MRSEASYDRPGVVYHNNGAPGGDHGEYFARLLTSLRNHLRQCPSLRIVVVCHGAGIDLLQHRDDDPKLLELRQNGIQFLACQNTLNARSIDPGQLAGVGSEDVVESGVATIAELQFQGFAYIHLS